MGCAYVVPVAAAHRIFDREGRIQDEGIELQLKTLGAEVVRVAERFADDKSLHREHECARAAERVAAASKARSAGGRPVAVPEAERPTQVSLAEQLDLVGWVPKLSRLDGLEGEPAVPLRHGDAGQEVAGLAGPGLPIRRDLGSCDVPPGRASLERVGEQRTFSVPGTAPSGHNASRTLPPPLPAWVDQGLRPERSRWRAGRSRRAGRSVKDFRERVRTAISAFEMKPSAPLVSMRSPKSAAERIEVSTTGGERPPSASRATTSKPSMSGKFTSTRTMSGSSSATAAMPSTPFSVSPTTTKPSASNRRRTVARNDGSSSMITMRGRTDPPHHSRDPLST